MQIKQIMSTPVVTVEMDDSLATIKEIFDHTHFHHLLVVEQARLLGVISDRDLLNALSPYIGTPSEGHRDLATLNRKAHQIMSRQPITLDLQADLQAAVRIFNAHRISCIPIVDAGNQPVGIVSWRDIMRTLLPSPDPDHDAVPRSR